MGRLIHWSFFVDVAVLWAMIGVTGAWRFFLRWPRTGSCHRQLLQNVCTKQDMQGAEIRCTASGSGASDRISSRAYKQRCKVCVHIPVSCVLKCHQSFLNHYTRTLQHICQLYLTPLSLRTTVTLQQQSTHLNISYNPARHNGSNCNNLRNISQPSNL